MANTALEISSKSQSSHLSWKWQWLLDQRKMLSDRVDQYMQQLHDKFFSSADVVREQLIQAAITFLTQPVPNVDVLSTPEAFESPVSQAEEMEKLQNAFQKLKQQTEEKFQSQREESSNILERLNSIEEETMPKLKDSVDKLECQIQHEIDGQLDSIEKLDQNLERIQKKGEQDGNRRDQELHEMKKAVDDLKNQRKEDARKIDQDRNKRDQQMKEMKDDVDDLKEQGKDVVKKQQEDRKSLSQLKN